MTMTQAPRPAYDRGTRAGAGKPPTTGRKGADVQRRTAFWLVAFPAVLVFSILLAALSLFSISRFAGER